MQARLGEHKRYKLVRRHLIFRLCICDLYITWDIALFSSPFHFAKILYDTGREPSRRARGRVKEPCHRELCEMKIGKSVYLNHRLS